MSECLLCRQKIITSYEQTSVMVVLDKPAEKPRRLLPIFGKIFHFFVGVPIPLAVFNEENSNKEGRNGLSKMWKKMSLPMKILFVTVDLGILLGLLYYFVFA